MLKIKPITVTLSADECWLPTLEKVVTDYAKEAEFPEPLTERIVSSTRLACSELVRHSLEKGIDEQFSVKLSCPGEACVVEIIYNKNVPLDPTAPDASDDEPHDPDHVSMNNGWLQLIKNKMDRVFFRYEADRRVFEMRSYRRDAGQVGRHWLMGLKPKIRDEVKLDIQRDERGDPFSSVLHDMDSGKVLKMDAGGTFVAERLDGAHTFYDIYMDYIDKIALTSPEHLAIIFTSLERAGMLERDAQEMKAPGILKRLSATIHKLAFRSLNIPYADRIVDALYERIKWLFSPVVIVLILVFALSGFVPFSREISEIHHLISKPALAIHKNPFILIELYVIMTLVAVLHEFSHALTCKHFGGRVDRIGIMFYLAMLIFFADVSSTWGFPNKWKRIAVAAAGPLLNLVVMSICFWIWHFQQALVPPEHSIWFLTGFFCLYSTILNFIPLIKMDGYYMLTDLTGISTLREKSFAFLGQKLAAIFGVKDSEAAVHPKGRERWILWVYGLAGVVGTAFFFTIPFLEFTRYIATRHPSKGMVIFFGVIVALTIYNAAYRAYQMAHSRLNREVVIA